MGIVYKQIKKYSCDHFSQSNFILHYIKWHLKN